MHELRKKPACERLLPVKNAPYASAADQGVHWNLGAPQLYQFALQGREARIAEHGPLVADTGVLTGRIPKDKFIVRDAETDAIVWPENNNSMSAEHFDRLLEAFQEHAHGKTLFAEDLYGGADPTRRVKSRIVQA
jgi:phosphoenolpyruvate carboxykinase (ATP)